MKNNLTSIGKILNFHGIQGEAKVGFSQTQRQVLSELKSVFVKTDFDFVELKINNVRFNKTFAIIKFNGINDVNEILKYKGALLFLEKGEVERTLEEGEYLIEDLIGLDVIVEGKRVGAVTGVSNNGANDMLAVKGLSEKISLVPMVKALIKEVNLEKKQVVVANLKGLIE